MSTPEEVSQYFGTIGRRVMVGGTYCLAAMLMFVTGWPLNHAVLTVAPRTVLWCVIFFFASAAACSAYLTVSEIFRNEIRTPAVAFFFAISVLAGGVVAPWLSITLMSEGSNRGHAFLGYTVASVFILIGGLIVSFPGVDAEQGPLETVATPLAARGPRAGAESGLTSHVRLPPAPDGSADRSLSGSAREHPRNAGLTGGQARGDVAHIALNNHRTDSSADKLTRRRGRRRRAPSGDGRSR